jgi:DNA invertase Pin-like site-specific DNA recombinase
LIALGKNIKGREQMTYIFNKEQHAAKIKAGLEKIKRTGKKLGRPKVDKLKNEDVILFFYLQKNVYINDELVKATYVNIAKSAGVSIGTVKRVIKKYKKGNKGPRRQ